MSDDKAPPSGRGVGSQALRKAYALARSFRAARVAMQEELYNANREVLDLQGSVRLIETYEKDARIAFRRLARVRREKAS